MPIVDTVVQCPVHDSFRVRQVAGLFDVTLDEKLSERFSVEVPDASQDWRIGAIVGPSGSGKSTVARQAFGHACWDAAQDWPDDTAIVDCFDPDVGGIKTITHALTAVGLSSPPAWVKPYSVLSNGERFRCNLARALLSPRDPLVFDEFTSVVDRTVAKIGSAAVSKALRTGRLKKRFVAVSCHYDILQWLQPDWVVDMAVCRLAWRHLQQSDKQRPGIRLRIFRCHRDAWRLFAKHHYLSGSLHPSAQCYLATWNESEDPASAKPVCFVAILHAVGHKDQLRVSRLVTLPDYQGIGIGGGVLDAVCDLACGDKRLGITTSHPAMIAHLSRSPRWRAISYKLAGVGRNRNRAYGRSEATERAVASFRYTVPVPPGHQGGQ